MRRLLALLTVFLLFGTAACGASNADPKRATGDSIAGLSVTGSFGSAPTVKVDPAVKVKEAKSRVLSKGSGDPVKLGGKALLNVYIANGKNGKKAVSTYDSGKPLSASIDEKQFFPAVVKALRGTPSGSRLAFADTVKDLYGADGAAQIGLKASDTLVFVIDVMSVSPTKLLEGPTGDKVDPPSDIPTIQAKGDAISKLTFEKAPKKPSGKLRVIQLVKGKGEPITGAQIVSMNYLGQVYGRPKPFNNSYSAEPTTFDVGIGQLIPGWDKALQGQRVGSRLMLIVPPAQGYGKAGNPDIKVTGKSTLVFVMDILAVG